MYIYLFFVAIMPTMPALLLLLLHASPSTRLPWPQFGSPNANRILIMSIENAFLLLLLKYNNEALETFRAVIFFFCFLVLFGRFWLSMHSLCPRRTDLKSRWLFSFWPPSGFCLEFYILVVLDWIVKTIYCHLVFSMHGVFELPHKVAHKLKRILD